jgi:hypothetical protein
LLFDSGCDISILGKGWWIVKDLNKIIYCRGPFLALGCSDDVACCLSNAVSIFEFPGMSIKPILVQLNHDLASDDPQQVETLIGTSQLMPNGVAVDMVPSVYPIRNAPGNGMQGMTMDGVNIPFLMMESNCCLTLPPYSSGTCYNATTGSYFNQAMASVA